MASTDIGLGPEPPALEHVHGERVAAVHHALAHTVGDDGGLEGFGELGDFLAGRLCTAADEDQRTVGLAEQLGGARGGVGVHRRVFRPGGRQRRDRGGAGPDIEGGFQPDRARAAAEHLAEGFGDFGGGLGRGVDTVGPFGQAAHDGELVGDLVKLAGAAADQGRGDLANQGEHRRIDGIGGGERGSGVEEAGAGNDGVGRRAAGGHGGAESHVGCALLVTGVDRADAILRAMQRVEQVVVLHAGQAEHGIDAVVGERGDGGLAGGHAFRRGHVRAP